MSETMIYVVMGQTGEYSDRREWPVLAFDSEKAAQDKVLELDTWLREHHVHEDDERRMPDYKEREKLKAIAPDPEIDIDYTGTRYYVMPVRFSVATSEV